MNCVIVDDDFSCVDALTGIIKNYCPQLQIVGAASSLDEAVKVIHATQPNLVFLDVEIHDQLGFDLFRFFPSPSFEVVFTTAHEKYALKAIKSSCYDFLLKPVIIDELVAVVSKLEHEKKNNPGENISVLLENLQSKKNEVLRIAIPSNSGYSFISVNDIISLEGEGKYTRLTTVSGLKHLSTRNIGEFEELLPASSFFRTHKSWIVNLHQIVKFLKSENQVQLTNNTLADVSLRKKEEFLRLFERV